MYKSEIINVFRNRLKELRNEKGLSQDKLAENLGISKGAISYYETGQRAPDIIVLSAIADYFNVSTDYLVGRSKNRIGTDDIENMNIIKKLNDRAIKNIHGLLTMNLSMPTVEGVFIPVPLAESCIELLSSGLFFELVNCLAELKAQGEYQLNNCGFSSDKLLDTLNALNISEDEFYESLSLLKSDYEFIVSQHNDFNISDILLILSQKFDDACDLARYKVSRVSEEISNLFDIRNTIKANENEKARFLKLLGISETELTKITQKAKMKNKEGD